MADWEQELIEELRQRGTGSAGAEKQVRAEAAAALFEELARQVETSVGRIAAALGLAVDRRGEVAEGRTRWIWAGRALALSLSRPEGRIALSCDTGGDLTIETFTATPRGLVDESDREVDVSEVVRRHVTLFFRGSG